MAAETFDGTEQMEQDTPMDSAETLESNGEPKSSDSDIDPNGEEKIDKDGYLKGSKLAGL